MNRNKVLTAVAGLALVCCSGETWAAEPPAAPTRVEARALWLAPYTRDWFKSEWFGADAKKGTEDIRQLAARLAEANFNLIFLLERNHYFAALSDPAYEKEIPYAKWDAFGELVKAAHAQGIQVHLWYSATGSLKPVDAPDFNPKHGGSPRWAAHDINGKGPDKEIGDFCPRDSKAREWQLNWISKVLDRYPLISGIHLEEHGYFGHGKGHCVCETCQKAFKEQHGADLKNEVDGGRAVEFRCQLMADLLGQIRDRVKKRHPKMVFTANAFSPGQEERQYGRDWRDWAKRGWLDGYVPQVYTNEDPDAFRKHAGAVINALGGQTPVLTGIAVQWSAGGNKLPSVLKNIDMARELRAQGVVFFNHARPLPREFMDAFQKGPFKERAALPKPMQLVVYADALETALKDKGKEVQEAAVRALLDTAAKPATVAPALRELLSAPQETVRDAAGVAMRNLNPDLETRMPELSKALLHKAQCSGKYQTLLRQFKVIKDVNRSSYYLDFGLCDAIAEYEGQKDLPKGYWVYVYPYWYIWRDLRR